MNGMKILDYLSDFVSISNAFHWRLLEPKIRMYTMVHVKKGIDWEFDNDDELETWIELVIEQDRHHWVNFNMGDLYE